MGKIEKLNGIDLTTDGQLRALYKLNELIDVVNELNTPKPKVRELEHCIFEHCNTKGYDMMSIQARKELAIAIREWIKESSKKAKEDYIKEGHLFSFKTADDIYTVILKALGIEE